MSAVVPLSSPEGSLPVIEESLSSKRALAFAERFAPTMVSVLLIGETGTGKEVFAARIHAASGRSGDFVDVNCAALPAEMVESLLFGHRRGAFTGAMEHAVGLIEQAEGGTLFLDELTSLPVHAQARLLRVLESRCVRRLGDRRHHHVDFRVVAAALPELTGCVASGCVRRDLFQRIAGVVIELEPLARRKLAAPVSKGIRVFVNLRASRRSLGALR